MVWTEGILPFNLNISSGPLKIAAHGPLTQLTKPQNMLQSSHVVTFYFAGKYRRCQSFAYIAHYVKIPWGDYLELDELHSIAAYKAHVKSSMNPN
jgi:hypothetical protein